MFRTTLALSLLSRVESRLVRLEREVVLPMPPFMGLEIWLGEEFEESIHPGEVFRVGVVHFHAPTGQFYVVEWEDNVDAWEAPLDEVIEEVRSTGWTVESDDVVEIDDDDQPQRKLDA